MKKKFFIFLIGILILGCVSFSSNTVKAKSYTSRHNLKAYVIPRKYRGNWKASRGFKIHVTSRHIQGKYIGGKHALTYKGSLEKSMKLPMNNKVMLVWHGGKWLIFAYPNSQPSSMCRSGNHLIVQIDTWKFKCHR